MYRVTLIYIATGLITLLAWYKRLARPVAFLERSERYVCRCDRAGVVYDKAAMKQVSRFLGHNRIEVIAGHYLHE